MFVPRPTRLLTFASTVGAILLAVVAVAAQPDRLAGDYRVDLSDLGYGVIVVKIACVDDGLTVQTGPTADPGRLTPIAGRAHVYEMVHPQEGRYEIRFLEADHGVVDRMQIRNETLGIDATGVRLAHEIAFPTLGEQLRSTEGRDTPNDELAGTRVALFFGPGMDPNSALSMGRAFQWMGCDVDVVDAEAIRRGILADYRLLAIPGGESDPDPWRDLGREGKSRIQSFVRAGGAYVGVCLGALFATSGADFWGGELGVEDLYLDLFPGIAHCGQAEVAPRGSWPFMVELERAAGDHPVLQGIPKRIRAVAYPNGPYFEACADADVSVIATFAATGKPAMVASSYGEGRVFLSGPHPEIEVDSDRDGSTRFHQLDDQGSEWPLLLAVTRWLTRS